MNHIPAMSGAPLRIVIADDQASVREGLVLLLNEDPDIEVVGAAADGEQALALVAEHQPDAILLDLHMPVLDGIRATRHLKSEHPGVAVVVLTTYADDSTVLDALQAGARSYLTKDADRTEIAQALRAAAQASRSWTPMSRPGCSPRPRHFETRHFETRHFETRGFETRRHATARRSPPALPRRPRHPTA